MRRCAAADVVGEGDLGIAALCGLFGPARVVAGVVTGLVVLLSNDAGVWPHGVTCDFGTNLPSVVAGKHSKANNLIQ